MKQLIFLLVAVFTFVGCASPRGDWSSNGKGLIRTVNGGVEVQSEHGGWRRARAGEKVGVRQTLRTSANGTAVVMLGTESGGSFRLHPNSEIRIEKIGLSDPTSDTIAVLDLTSGRVTGDTLQLPPNTKIVVKTPNGMHEIR